MLSPKRKLIKFICAVLLRQSKPSIVFIKNNWLVSLLACRRARRVGWPLVDWFPLHSNSIKFSKLSLISLNCRPINCATFLCFLPSLNQFDLFGCSLFFAEHWAVPAPLTHKEENQQIKSIQIPEGRPAAAEFICFIDFINTANQSSFSLSLFSRIKPSIHKLSQIQEFLQVCSFQP